MVSMSILSRLLNRGISFALRLCFFYPDAGGDKCKLCLTQRFEHQSRAHAFVEV